MDPPTQDSPQHILNVLNDDCIDEIFLRLNNLKDFLSVSQACQKFVESAKRTFPTQFKCVEINQFVNFRNRREHENLPYERVHNFFTTFGSLTKSIAFSSTSYQQRDDFIFETITNFCSGTLQEFNIVNYNPNFERRNFSALEKLDLCYASPKNFTSYSMLKVLSICQSTLIQREPWFMLEMPNLEEIYFDSFDNLTDRVLGDFLKLNPHLKCLKLIDCKRLTPAIFQLIGCFTDLIKLVIKHDRFPEIMANQRVLQLRRLHKLERLTLWCSVSLQTVIKMISENNIPIKKLSMKPTQSFLCNINENLRTSYTLKHLRLTTWTGGIFDDALKNVLKQQQGLETIYIYCWRTNRHYRNNYLTGIEDTLRYGKNLKHILSRIDQLTVTLSSYEAILRLAKGRVKVEIAVLQKLKIDIPKKVLEANSEWLEIVQYRRL